MSAQNKTIQENHLRSNRFQVDNTNGQLGLEKNLRFLDEMWAKLVNSHYSRIKQRKKKAPEKKNSFPRKKAVFFFFSFFLFFKMTRFNGCIDLHHGKVKQIVGGSLVDHSPETLTTNFVSE